MGLKLTNSRGIASRSQRGVTLMELIIAIALISLLSAMAAMGYASWSRFERNQNDAQWFKTWSAAAQSYIHDHASALAGGGTVTQAQLASGGYFGANSFNTLSPYGESATLHVVPGSGGRLQGLICATGGQPLDGMTQRNVAGAIGVGGGWVSAAQPSIATGKAWGPVNLSDYGIGSGGCNIVVALFVTDLATVDDYLHRSATPGHPEYNAMTTAINMQGNDINNAGTVNGNTAQLTGRLGVLGLPANSGYPSGWAGGVHTWDLYAEGSIGLGKNGNKAIELSSAGTANFSSDVNVYGYLGVHNSIWASGPISSSNNISATGTISAGGDISTSGAVYANNWFRANGATGLYWQSYGGGWYMQDSTWIRAYNNKSIVTGGTVQAGSIHSTGRLYADEFIQLGHSVAAGAGCGPNGLVGRESNGALVSCVSGKWTAPGASNPNYHYAGANYTGLSGKNTTGHTLWVIADGSSSCNSYGELGSYGRNWVMRPVRRRGDPVLH